MSEKIEKINFTNEQIKEEKRTEESRAEDVEMQSVEEESFFANLEMYDFSRREMIEYLETNKILLKLFLIATKEALIKNKDCYFKSLENIQFLSRSDQVLLQDHLGKIIEEKFNKNRNRFSKNDVKILRYISTKKRTELIPLIVTKLPHLKKAVHKLLQPSISTYHHLNDMFSKINISITEKDRTREAEVFLQKLAVESPLYANDKEFSMKEFNKTGSRMFLFDKLPGLSKSLKNEIIIRDVDLNSYLIWNKVFKDHNFWKAKGFSYVPIEPIKKVLYYSVENNKVGIETRVIKGPNMGDWFKNNGYFQKQILGQGINIINGLTELGIDHGHLHRYNFVLDFPKDKDDKADISSPPRIYVIDFDRAAFLK